MSDDIPKKYKTKYFDAAIRDIGERDFPEKQDVDYELLYEVNTFMIIRLEDKYYKIKYDRVNQNEIESKVAGYQAIKSYPDLFVIPKSINFSPEGTPEDQMFLYYQIDGREDRQYSGSSLKKMDAFFKKLYDFTKKTSAAFVNLNMDNIVTDSDDNIKIRDVQELIFMYDLEELYRIVGDDLIPRSKLENFVDVKLDENDLFIFMLSILKLGGILVPYQLFCIMYTIRMYQFKKCVFYDVIPRKLYEQLVKTFIDFK